MRNTRTYLAILLITLLQSGCVSEKEDATTVPCPDIVTGCALPQSGLQVRFNQIPRPMQAFKVDVVLPEARSVYARFVMQGMEMGLNRYRLLPDGTGRWQAEVMLPACVQGRRDWLLILEADGARYQLPFSSL
jgi:hypothetical protein